jgi:hypothetical protein
MTGSAFALPKVLSVGTHTISLFVMNEDNATAEDDISVTVKAANTANSSSSGGCFIYTTACRRLMTK